MTTQILKTPLSQVGSVRQTKTRPLNLGDALAEITGTKYAPVIAEIRRLQESGQIAEAKAFKKKSLPAIMFAGTFSTRNNSGLVQHSGLMVLDFDDGGTDQKELLAADPHSILCFVSPRGRGLKLVIRIEPAPNSEEHGESFDAAKAYFRDTYGIEADPSGRDVCRLCFFSHDPDAIFKPKGEVLHRPHRPYRQYNDHTDNVSKVEREGCKGVAAQSVGKVLELTQPTQPGQRHRQLFNFARGLKFECGFADTPLPELKPIVREWFDMAKPKIGTQVFSESWSDFVHAWPRVKTPLSTNTLEAVWGKVLAGDLPPIAEDYDKQEIKQLVGICWHLGHNAESFYLSNHKAGPLLNVKPMQVWRWLRMFQADQILKLVKTGNESLANTYRWIHKASKK